LANCRFVLGRGLTEGRLSPGWLIACRTRLSRTTVSPTTRQPAAGAGTGCLTRGCRRFGHPPEGHRVHQGSRLIGYGLIVGLNKTGDKRQTIFTAQTIANMLQRFGLSVPGQQMKIENVAAVLVTAELQAYARPGARIDVTASSIGDARSLQGGTLLATPLRGGNGGLALAQGDRGRRLVAATEPPVGRSSRRRHRDAEQRAADANCVPDFQSACAAGDQHRTWARDRQRRRPERIPHALDADGALNCCGPTRPRVRQRTHRTVVVGDAAAAAPAPLGEDRANTCRSRHRSHARRHDEVETPVARGTTPVARNKASPRDIIAIMQALKAAGALKADLVVL
jgi:hypothetical protein